MLQGGGLRPSAPGRGGCFVGVKGVVWSRLMRFPTLLSAGVGVTVTPNVFPALGFGASFSQRASVISRVWFLKEGN